jgi:small subunit ribosomal protein S20
MPKLHSAVKRARLSEKARRTNRAVKSKISTLRRQVFESIATKDKAKAQQAWRAYCSVLDRAAKTGIIKKNAAIRRKRRANARVTALEQAL